MENFKQLLRLAKRFELKYTVAQKVSAQPGDIESALKQAGLMDPNLVAPLLPKAGVADDQNVDIKVNFDAGGKVTFTVLINPANPKAAQTLAALLTKNFAGKMAQAVNNGNLAVTNPVTVGWVTF